MARQTKTREYKDLDAHFTANLGYSHHQKAVIVDAAPPAAANQSIRLSKSEQQENNGKMDGNNAAGVGGKRRIIAYVGGIDLTGKYISKITACISTVFTYCAKEVIRSNEKVNCFQMEDTTLLSIASSNRWSMSIKTTFISLVSPESKHAMDHACLGKIFTQGWRGRPLGIS